MGVARRRERRGWGAPPFCIPWWYWTIAYEWRWWRRNVEAYDTARRRAAGALMAAGAFAAL